VLQSLLLPWRAQKAADEAIATYNSTSHESLNNVSPNDVYAGKKKAILRERHEKRILTVRRRKQYNLETHNNSPNQLLGAN